MFPFRVKWFNLYLYSKIKIIEMGCCLAACGGETPPYLIVKPKKRFRVKYKGIF